MAHRNIIAVGASAGGVEALRTLAASLPPDLPATLLVVLHVPAGARSSLPSILRRASRLKVRHAVDGEPIVPGEALIAPPDVHLFLEGERVRLTRGPRVNSHRPAIDPLFYSVAQHAGPRAVGVILSGTLDDGASGMAAIKRRRGLCVVQDPSDAAYDGMPRAVMAATRCDAALPIDALGAYLARVVREEIVLPTAERELASEPAQEAELSMDQTTFPPKNGAPSPYACPDCHGVLWEVEDGALLRYRCRVGHAFSPESLVDSQTKALEDALWAAYRALRETASFSERLAKRNQGNAYPAVREMYERRAHEATERADLIESVLARGLLGEGAPRGAEGDEPEPNDEH